MRVRRSRATSAGISPRWTASCRADSVWERRDVGARSLCAPGTSTPALARWRTALASTTNLVIGYLRTGVGASQHYRCAPPRPTPAAPHGAQESSGTTTSGPGFDAHLVVLEARPDRSGRPA